LQNGLAGMHFSWLSGRVELKSWVRLDAVLARHNHEEARMSALKFEMLSTLPWWQLMK